MFDNITTFKCEKCKGKTKYKAGNFYYYCPECQGKGFVDWIDNILGRKKSFNEEIINELRNKMAEEIDREIIAVLTKGDINDNGGFSKFMLFDSTKQKESSKKDKNPIQRSSSSTEFLRRERNFRCTNYNKK